MVLLVLSPGNWHRTEYLGLGSTHPCIIWWSEEFSSLNSGYVYDEDAFDDGKLGGDVLKTIIVIVCSFVPIYSQLLKHICFSQSVPFHIPCFLTFWFYPWFYKSFCWGVSLVARGKMWLRMVACQYLFSRCWSCHMFHLQLRKTQHFGLFYTLCVWRYFSRG